MVRGRTLPPAQLNRAKLRYRYIIRYNSRSRRCSRASYLLNRIAVVRAVRK